MAKASTTKATAKAPAKRDPFDYDGDGKKGGPMHRAKRTSPVVAETPAAVVDGTPPDPVIAAQAVGQILQITADTAVEKLVEEEASRNAERGIAGGLPQIINVISTGPSIEEFRSAATGSGRIMATVSPGQPVAKVKLPELTPDLHPAGALLVVYREPSGRTRVQFANGAVRHPKAA
jgi:hypothetical protein